MAKTKEKFELINDILPAIAKKSAQILDRPIPNLAGSITKIMSAVICESDTEWNKETKSVDVSIKIYNYTARESLHNTSEHGRRNQEAHDQQ